MRLSVSPATPFLDASLPNHTKMFEFVHMVTSMNDFGVGVGAGRPGRSLQYHGRTGQRGRR